MIASYTVEHAIRFDYETPVGALVMTLYLCPFHDRAQTLCEFSLRTDPDGRLYEFTDPFGNTAHFLDRPRLHTCFEVRSRSHVEVGPLSVAPDRLDPGAAEALHSAVHTPEFWMLAHPSCFVRPSPALDKFVAAHGITLGDDPLVSARELCAKLHDVFEYIPGHTHVDSPIEDILETGQGVCQDYAHVMASIVRGWGVPCRYVSGYLGPETTGEATGESHAWVECWFPGVGWLGFDPTNNTEGDERHVRVAIGRDYADVPPSRGVFRGNVGSSLATEVKMERHSDNQAEKHCGVSGC